MSEHLLFFMSCDSKYFQFIKPFMYFSSLDNKPCSYEFLLTSVMPEEEKESIEKLAKSIGAEVKLVDKSKDSLHSKVVRWLYSPASKGYSYAYIGDIDIIILENVTEFHRSRMDDGKLFDNVVRHTDKSKLSGLQFCTRDYFERTFAVRSKYKKICKGDMHCSNESILLKICKESGLKLPQASKDEEEFNRIRPVHGIHMSLSRKPFKAGSAAELTFSQEDAAKLFKIIESNEFKENILPQFDEAWREKLGILVAEIRSKSINNI